MLEYYKRIRANGAKAQAAITLARSNIAAGREWWKIPARRNIDYNPEASTGGRWIENASQGLRFTGFADDLSRWIDHRGWFTNDDGLGDETLRGVVYQLPARNGAVQYVAGYADPHNDDCALLDFTTIYEEKTDAARAGDRMAQTAAERECEYDRAWRDGNNYAQAGQDLQQVRKDTIALVQAIRLERNRGAASVICDALRSQVQQLAQQAQALREKRASLADGYTSGSEAFKDGAACC